MPAVVKQNNKHQPKQNKSIYIIISDEFPFMVIIKLLLLRNLSFNSNDDALDIQIDEAFILRAYQHYYNKCKLIE